jgi:Cu-Zn family superoxide dismutase
MVRALSVSFALAAALAAAPAFAATVSAELAKATPEGAGPAVGTVTIADSPQGAVVALDLKGLPPGEHGFHLHQNASCAPGPGPDGKVIAAGAAGGHWDPDKTGHHMGPEGQGHMGDLPRVTVAADGTVKASLTAPRIKDVSALRGHALMLHAGGDNYSDTPPLGGGGARFACGVLN